MTVPTTHELPEFIDTGQVAEMFSVKRATIRDWIRRGDLDAVRLNGYWKVKRQSLIDFMNARFGG